MVVVQVVPKLYPAIDGLGDYALNLARQLRKDFGIETHFIAGDSTWTGATQIEGFRISQVSDRSAKTLLSLLPDDRQQPATILLHYSNYGYANRGCPVWLVDGLQRWRTASGDRLLVTMFHELYAFGPPWASSFWLSPVQKNLAVRLATWSDRILTNRQDYAKTLHELSRGKHATISTIPVISNIGEPEQLPPLAKRDRRLVVFGHQNSRLQAYQQDLAAVEQTCQALKIEEICDIGVPTGLALSQINGIPVVEMGVTKPTKISVIMQNSIAGFLSVPLPKYLGKSSIFAAYCAHRLIPILTSYSAVPVDGLQTGKHYWVAGDRKEQLCLDAGQAIADNAYNWYQTHSLPIQAKIFAAHLDDRSQEGING